MSTQHQNKLSISSLALLAVAFVLAVIVSNQLFKGARLDLTENRLYTLSDGTERIVESIDEPINLYFYFSDEATGGIPSLRDYAMRVREMLEEFEAAARGKIRLTVIDPLPFSEEEDRAAQYGLQGIRLNVTPDPVYLGLAGTNSVGDEEIIPFFQLDEEASLEYDIAKLISLLANPEQTAVGLVSGIPINGSFDPESQRMQPPWIVYEQVDQLFELQNLGTSFDAVPEEIGLLWIVQPKGLSASTQYAIDQFIMRGGKALIFVDPMAGVDAAVSQGMPQGMPPLGQSSDLPLLFDGWGIEFDANQVAADARLALQISNPMSGAPVRHYGYLGLDADNMNADDATTAELGSINMAMAGVIRLAADSAASLTPLLTTSTASMLLPSSRFVFLPDPAALLDNFEASGERMPVGVRIRGILPSAFPDGPPQADGSEEHAQTGHLGESQEAVNLIVVADVDMLSDPLWVQTQRIFGQQIASAFASNGAFVANALESAAGDANLISVRSRGSFARPFTRVDKLHAEAEAKFRATEQRLNEELSETERRLGELQASRDESGGLLLTPEQQAEIDRFIDQRTSIRKELRAVQRGLDEEIDNLGTVLKLINIGLVPLLLTIAVLVSMWRRRRGERL